MWRWFSLPPLFSLAGVELAPPVSRRTPRGPTRTCCRECLSGRYIQLNGWDSHLASRGRDRHRFLIPPSRLPGTAARPSFLWQKNPQSPKESRLEGSPALPTRAPKAQVSGVGDPPAHLLFTVLPSPRTSAPFTPHPLPKLRGPRSSKALAFHPAVTVAMKSLPGSHPLQPRGWRWKSFRVGGRAAAVPAPFHWTCSLSGAGGRRLGD